MIQFSSSSCLSRIRYFLDEYCLVVQMNEIYDVEETSEVNEKNWEPDPQLLEGESAALHIDNRVEETYVDEEHVEHEEYIEENACET